jgi:hypothetical protein
MLTPMSARPRASRPGSRLLAAVVAAALCATLAACASAKGSIAEKPDSQPVAGGTELAALWPLTGEPVTGSTPDRPVLVTKIDNTANSRPQVGLKKADLITEELVEGGMTRLAVFFYQHLPGVVGPVRSMRASDIGIVKPAHGVIVASGAAPPTLARLKRADVTYFEEGGPGYFREGSRRAPYNLMVRLPELAKAVEDEAVVPASYLPWGKESDFSGGRPARSLDAVFSRSHTTSWSYRGGRYVNENSNAAAGDRFLPDSVLVLRVRQGDAGYLDPAGNKVPETLYVGRGQAMLFHHGQVVRGTWSKRAKRAPVRLRTSAGPMKVPAGHVWVELVPTDKAGGRVAFRK